MEKEIFKNDFQENRIVDEIKNKEISISSRTLNDIFKFSFFSEEEKSSYASEYLNEIYQNLLLEEKYYNLKPKYGYMKNQNEINSNMRAILINWLIEIDSEFYFKPDTLFKCIMIVDIYLSKNTISRDKFQLLGVTALFIAFKLNENCQPSVSKFISLTADSYSKAEVISMENNILKCLDYNLIFPTSIDFYNIISKAYKFNNKQYFFGKFLLEISLLDDNFILFSPSEIACGCCYLVMKKFALFSYYSLYKEKILLNEYPEITIKCIGKSICDLIVCCSGYFLKVLIKKYSLPRFSNVVTLIQDLICTK